MIILEFLRNISGGNDGTGGSDTLGYGIFRVVWFAMGYLACQLI